MRAYQLGMAGLLGALAMAPVAAMAQPAKPSVETTPVSQLITNPKIKDILQKDWPNFSMAPMDMIGGMTLRAIAGFPPAELTDAMLKKIQADLDALAAAS